MMKFILKKCWRKAKMKTVILVHVRKAIQRSNEKNNFQKVVDKLNNFLVIFRSCQNDNDKTN